MVVLIPLREQLLILGNGKLGDVMEKVMEGHGKSWNFKRLKEYEPCTCIVVSSIAVCVVLLQYVCY